MATPNTLPPAAPAMYEEWETERGHTLDAFARLVGKGHPPRRAAARLGASVPALRALSATVQGH